MDLVMGTAAAESGLTYLSQVGGGPGVGLWQMEPETHMDVWRNWLDFRGSLAGRVLRACLLGEIPGPGVMAWNLRYAALMCRIHYRRVAEPLPAARDWAAMARYWKQHYNTVAGAGRPDQFIDRGRRARVIPGGGRT